MTTERPGGAAPMRGVWRIALGVVAILTLGGCPHGKDAGPTLKAGGSTFIAPIMDEWRYLYEKEKGVRVDYTPGGSGRGISSMAEGLYAFGCTDAFLTDKERATAKAGAVLHVPLVLGA